MSMQRAMNICRKGSKFEGWLEWRFLTYCYFCNEEIYGYRIDEVNFFYNHKFIGYPICIDCKGDLKTNGQDPYELTKERVIGIPRKKIKKKPSNLDTWLK